MALLANWLVHSGCRYAVCAGLNCLEWHDAIDAADIIRDPNAENLIMTTWHEYDVIEDIVWHWLNLTDFENITFNNYLSLLIGSSKEIEDKIKAAIKNNHL